MQALVELKVSVEAISGDDFSCLVLALEGLGSAEETDANSGVSVYVAWFDAGGDALLVRARIVAATLLAGVDAAAIQLRELDSDWETAWQKDWQAMPIGERLWVRPSFCPPPPSGRLDIVLDPGMAFGTGTHPTTRLCLTAIESLCVREAPLSLLDMGAGSGILAIAAVTLGVVHALAVDNDPVALEACRINAKANGVSIDCHLADAPPAGVFDLVVANILAGPLIKMAKPLTKCVGRQLVLSGLLAEQVDAVSRAYKAEGLKIERVDEEGEWAAMLCGK